MKGDSSQKTECFNLCVSDGFVSCDEVDGGGRGGRGVPIFSRERPTTSSFMNGSPPPPPEAAGEKVGNLANTCWGPLLVMAGPSMGEEGGGRLRRPLLLLLPRS